MKYIASYLSLLLMCHSHIMAISSFLPSSTDQISNLPRPAFMDLYSLFTTYSDDKNTPGIGQALSETINLNSKASEPGVLILALNSDLYIFDSAGNKILQQAVRAEKDTGFFELTAISHIGPAISYILAIKNNNGDWKPLMQRLYTAIVAAKKANSDTQMPWLKQVNASAWQPFLSKIQNMNTYALNMSEAFTEAILSEKLELTAETVNNQFLKGNDQYPIPFNNVMIGTFMLTTLTEMVDLQQKIEPLKIDWTKAKVILRFVAGTNYTSGLSLESNWIGYYLNMVSGKTLPKDNLLIIPYAEIKTSVTSDKLSAEDLDYYATKLWTTTHQRTQIAKKVLTSIPDITTTRHNPIPGDYGYSSANNIDDFIIRLKFSLANSTEMLSNATAFWMAGELQSKQWDYAQVEIPGLTTGFPEGISEYPSE